MSIPKAFARTFLHVFFPHPKILECLSCTMNELEILTKKVELLEKIMEAIKQMVFAQQTQIENHAKSFQVIAEVLKKMEGVGDIDLDSGPGEDES
jgi:hypothetical protein